MCAGSWASLHNHFLFVSGRIPTPQFVIATRGKYQDSSKEQTWGRVSLQCGLSLCRASIICAKPRKAGVSPAVSHGGSSRVQVCRLHHCQEMRLPVGQFSVNHPYHAPEEVLSWCFGLGVFKKSQYTSLRSVGKSDVTKNEGTKMQYDHGGESRSFHGLDLRPG